jgi:hypothetical protein
MMMMMIIIIIIIIMIISYTKFEGESFRLSYALSAVYCQHIPVSFQW